MTRHVPASLSYGTVFKLSYKRHLREISDGETDVA
jgi:hypothetical protein